MPYRGAEPPFPEKERLVCLRPDDFAHWEIRARILSRVAGFHAALPTLNLAHRLIVSHLRGKATKGVWGRPAPGVPEHRWEPPIRGLRYKR